MFKRAFTTLTIVALTACVAKPNITRHNHLGAVEAQLGFTQVVQHNNTLYLSGLVGTGDDMAAQIDFIYTQLKRILAQHGASTDDIVKETIFTTDMRALAANAAVRKKHYNESKYPASSWIEVKGLFFPQYLLEVEVEVILSEK